MRSRQPIVAAGFPHGEEKGYSRGCGCPDCRAAHSRAEKRRHLRRARGDLAATSSVPLGDQVRARVRELIAAVPFGSVEGVAHAAHVSATSLEKVMRQTTPGVSARIATAIGAVTVEQVAAARRRLPAAPYRDKVRRMQAAGYSLRWQARTLGVAQLSVANDHASYVTVDVARRIDTLFTQVGLALATPANSGQPQDVIRKARTYASRRGYYPPGCYDEDGALDVRAIPDHPWSKADDRAGRNLDVLRALLTADPDEHHQDIADRLGVTVRHVGRVATAAGITATNPDAAAAHTRAADVLAAYDRRDLDVVHAALTLHLVDPWGLPRDHPGVLTYQATITPGVAA